MANSAEDLPHLVLTSPASDQPYQWRGGGGGNPKIRDVLARRAIHGDSLRRSAAAAFDQTAHDRGLLEEDMAELQANGTFLTILAASGFPLDLDALDSRATKPRWFLVSVDQDPSGDERAVVWVRDEARKAFLKRFDAYARSSAPLGKAPTEKLMANVAEIQRTLLEHVWTSDRPPAITELGWWELWLDDDPASSHLPVIETFAKRRGLRLAKRRLTLGSLRIVWIRAQWYQLQELLLLDVPLREIRRPQLIEAFTDLSSDEQEEYLSDLADRIVIAGPDAPAVCLLDTGVESGHPLISGSLDPADSHHVVGSTPVDTDGHGTEMAGIALFGSELPQALESSEPVVLSHRLESVRLLEGRGASSSEPLTFGVVTADAVAQPEITNPTRPRVFSLPITAQGPLGDHQATLWSATIDALAAGAAVTRRGDELEILTAPQVSQSRLFFVSAGNVRESDGYDVDHLSVSSGAAIEEPAQAHNVVTVGAFTDLAELPINPDFQDWEAVAGAGDLSPFSRTSYSQPHLPIKPDICLEGGNLLSDGGEDFASHPSVSLLTTSRRGSTSTRALTHTNATSAATAQAARLAARIMAELPHLWPETIRALLVHSARWTDPMKARVQVGASQLKSDRASWIRRYGWGVPNEQRLLRSTRSAVTLIAEDSFSPFANKTHDFARCRLHRLPWPAAALAELGAETVRVRVTLSYFIEPNARRRGWKSRYVYESHGLRFALKRPTENDSAFLRRVTNSGQAEDGADAWLVGPTARDRGSVHQDIWEGSGADLAQQGSIGVFPTAGWWKRNKRDDRADRTVRYSLVVSIETDRADIDLYTPIAAQIGAGEINV